MQAILIIEYKGFAQLSTGLAMKMEEINLTPEKVRAGIIELTNNLLKSVYERKPYNESYLIGGDTFITTFNEVQEAVDFSTTLFAEFLKAVQEQGYYYLKPCACIGFGELQMQGERFLDDTSIETYRIADSRPPFTIWIKGKEAINRCVSNGYQIYMDEAEVDLQKLEWLKMPLDSEAIGIPDIKLPQLLLDNEVIFSKSPEDSVNKIRQYQNSASSVYAFGGPIPYDIAFYNDYLKETISLVKSNDKIKWTIISYLDLSDKRTSFYWLELTRRISGLYPNRYNFTAYTISSGTLIPFSYQIFDKKIAHIGLRSFSLERGKSTMNASMIFKNERIAERYIQEFTESYRLLGKFDDSKFSELIQKINLSDSVIKQDCLKLVDELLK